MRVALFSPLPPCRSGIADYSETLVEHLKPLVDLEVFADGDRPFDPSRFDIALYHLGNNPHHGFVYEAALRHPGVVAMHESNLHHLMETAPSIRPASISRCITWGTTRTTVSFTKPRCGIPAWWRCMNPICIT